MSGPSTASDGLSCRPPFPNPCAHGAACPSHPNPGVKTGGGGLVDSKLFSSVPRVPKFALANAHVAARFFGSPGVANAGLRPPGLSCPGPCYPTPLEQQVAPCVTDRTLLAPRFAGTGQVRDVASPNPGAHGACFLNPVTGAGLAPSGDARGPVPPDSRVPVQVAEAAVGSTKRGGAQGGEEGSCANKVRRVPGLTDVACRQRFEPSPGCVSKFGLDNVQVCPLKPSGQGGARIGQAAAPPSGAAECPFRWFARVRLRLASCWIVFVCKASTLRASSRMTRGSC